MDLIQLDKLCRQYAPAEYAADDFVAVAAALSSTLVPVHNPKSWTYAELADIPEIGMDGVRILINTLKAADATDPLMGPTHTALSTQGLRLDHPVRQAMIDTLGTMGSWDAQIPGLTDAVKQAGVKQEVAWEYHGLESVPTDTDCSDAKTAKAAADAAAAEEQAVRLVVSQVQNTYHPVIELVNTTGSSITNAQIVTAFSNQLDALRP
jgi:hypothetical protein